MLIIFLSIQTSLRRLEWTETLHSVQSRSEAEFTISLLPSKLKQVGRKRKVYPSQALNLTYFYTETESLLLSKSYLNASISCIRAATVPLTST